MKCFLIVLATVTQVLTAAARDVAAPSMNCAKLGSQIITVKKNTLHPTQFCETYLSTSRIRSPFTAIKAPDLIRTCSCVLKQAGVRIPIPKSVTVLKSSRDLECEPKWATKIKKEFVQARAFCKFFRAVPRAETFLSGVDPKGMHEGCLCILGSQTTISKRRTTTTKKTIRKTSSRKTATSDVKSRKIAPISTTVSPPSPIVSSLPLVFTTKPSIPSSGVTISIPRSSLTTLVTPSRLSSVVTSEQSTALSTLPALIPDSTTLPISMDTVLSETSASTLVSSTSSFSLPLPVSTGVPTTTASLTTNLNFLSSSTQTPYLIPTPSTLASVISTPSTTSPTSTDVGSTSSTPAITSPVTTSTTTTSTTTSPATTTTTPAQAGNLLLNPSFETAATDGSPAQNWALQNSAPVRVVGSNPQDGTALMRFTTSSSSSTQLVGIKQSLALGVSTAYTFTGYFRVNSVTTHSGSTVAFYVNINGATGSYRQSLTDASVTIGQWMPISFGFTTSSSAMSGGTQFSAFVYYGSTGPGSYSDSVVDLDNLSIS